MIGYRFSVVDSSVYIIKLEAYEYRRRFTLDYDTTDFVVLGIINANTFVKTEEITAKGVEGINITYKVGERITWPASIRHGVYFFPRVSGVMVYLEVDENMNISYNYDSFRKRFKEDNKYIFRKDTTVERIQNIKRRQVLSNRLQASLDNDGDWSIFGHQEGREGGG